MRSGGDSTSRQAALGLRLILATRRLDRAYARLDRLRSSLILALASDAALQRFNDWTYSRSRAYQPGAPQHRRELFPWEEVVLERFFPSPPARILIGGAGSGREPFKLVEMGFQVVAFEPVPALAEAITTLEPRGSGSLDVYRGGYESLPWLTRVADGRRVTLDRLRSFDAAILGWGSFTHITTEPLRRATLAAFSEVTRGPILVSFIAVASESGGARGRTLLTRLSKRHAREPGDRFSMHMGFQHPVSAGELHSLAEHTGLRIVALDLEGGDTLAPHAVFTP